MDYRDIQRNRYLEERRKRQEAEDEALAKSLAEEEDRARMQEKANIEDHARKRRALEEADERLARQLQQQFDYTSPAIPQSHNPGPAVPSIVSTQPPPSSHRTSRPATTTIYDDEALARRLQRQLDMEDYDQDSVPIPHPIQVPRPVQMPHPIQMIQQMLLGPQLGQRQVHGLGGRPYGLGGPYPDIYDEDMMHTMPPLPMRGPPVFMQFPSTTTIRVIPAGAHHHHSGGSYEQLLRLAEAIPGISRGATSESINDVPTRRFNKATMPKDAPSQCNICLADYEEGEEIKSLPSCLHSFHKQCIDKWLTINKTCPVCRREL